jgi:hypothetical protein
MRIDFKLLASRCLRHSDSLVKEILPEGHQRGNEWISRNPMRCDRNPGSFSINLKTGKWADFATGDCGGDIISLIAYIYQEPQLEAAKRLNKILGGTI